MRGILHEDTGIIDGLAIQQIRVNGKWRDGKKSRYVSGHTVEASRQNYFTVVLSSNKKGDSPILIDCYYERVMPAEPYYLWVLTNAGNTLYISQEKELYGRTPGSFEGGGTNWSAAVTYQPLAGPFHTREEAEAAFCKGLSARWTNNVVPWGPFVTYLFHNYGAFENCVEGPAYECDITIVKWR